MRLALLLLVIGTFLAPLGIVLSDAEYEREAQDWSAGSRVGTPFLWPDDVRVADPAFALRVLADAAGVTGANVIRESLGTTPSGRTSITYYLYLARHSTALFGAFKLGEGRWLTRDETQNGSAVVSSTPAGKADVVGRPRVLADAYDLTFQPLRSAFDSLPAGGQYVVESRSSADTDQFLAVVLDRLTAAGMRGLTAESLRSTGSEAEAGALPEDHLSLWFLPYALIPVLSLLVVSILLREGKSIGVLRLTGHSTARIWFMTVGRLQLGSILAAVLGCVVILTLVPGVDASFASSLASALLRIALASLGVTSVMGGVMVHRMHVGELVKGRVQ